MLLFSESCRAQFFNDAFEVLWRLHLHLFTLFLVVIVAATILLLDRREKVLPERCTDPFAVVKADE